MKKKKKITGIQIPKESDILIQELCRDIFLDFPLVQYLQNESMQRLAMVIMEFQVCSAKLLHDSRNSFRLCLVFCYLSRIILVVSEVLCTELLQPGRRESWLFGAYLKLTDLFHIRAAQASSACLSKKYMPASWFSPVLCVDGIRIIDFLRSY